MFRKNKILIHSKEKKFKKRRPTLVISNDNYNKQTGFVAVCPITHGQQKLKAKVLLVEVQSKKVDGFVNPFQLHIFDYKARQAEKITILDNFAFARVVQLNRFIFSGIVKKPLKRHCFRTFFVSLIALLS